MSESQYKLYICEADYYIREADKKKFMKPIKNSGY